MTKKDREEREYGIIKGTDGNIIKVFKEPIPLNEIIPGLKDKLYYMHIDEPPKKMLLGHSKNKIWVSESRLVQVEVAKGENVTKVPLEVVQKEFCVEGEAERNLKMFKKFRDAGARVPPIVAKGPGNSIYLTNFGARDVDFYDPVYLMHKSRTMRFNKKETYADFAKQVRTYHNLNYVCFHEVSWGVCFFVKKEGEFIPVLVDIENLRKEKDKKKRIIYKAYELGLISLLLGNEGMKFFLEEYEKNNEEAGEVRAELANKLDFDHLTEEEKRGRVRQWREELKT